MQQWFHDHSVISYLLIVAFTIYIFNAVFRTGRLPILKEILVHLFLAVGCLILLLLQLDKLPIIQCMAVAVGMMALLRMRQFYDKRKAYRNGKGGGSSSVNSADPQ
ncbi:YlaH-like family protein [Cohnella silvisoli]|uniref:YlaH-like family protein n=1 Tax=Cohnella silvisoli TaxID=2873699 RepID=A0ABV1KYF7_9BACL|nr:YlaH-like family protein [Cohnella silvisoli]MCD9024461.1 YlaH-like family protein [Cohnella silvisoli]